MELGLRAFSQSPGTCLAVHFPCCLCHGAATALCLCVIWTVASPPPHLVPLPTGAVPATPFLEPIGGEPLPWGTLVEDFPRPNKCFYLFPTFVRVMRVVRVDPLRQADQVG